MSDQSAQLADPNDHRGQLGQAKALYADARRAGKSKAHAKAAVYAALPGFREAASFGTALGSPWARAIQAVEHQLIIANHDPGNGNGNGTATYSPTDDMLAYILALDPTIGETITLNLHYLAWRHRKANDAAWRSALGPNGALAKTGWRFEILNTSGRCYQVRVVERPQSEEQREIARLQALATTLQEEIARLQAKSSSQRPLL